MPIGFGQMTLRTSELSPSCLGKGSFAGHIYTLVKVSWRSNNINDISYVGCRYFPWCRYGRRSESWRQQSTLLPSYKFHARCSRAYVTLAYPLRLSPLTDVVTDEIRRNCGVRVVLRQTTFYYVSISSTPHTFPLHKINQSAYDNQTIASILDTVYVAGRSASHRSRGGRAADGRCLAM